MNRIEQLWGFTAMMVHSGISYMGVQTLYVEPANPQQNYYDESFNGKLSDVPLNGDIFHTLREAQVMIERWPQEFNATRPHSVLGYRPPAPEAVLLSTDTPLPPTSGVVIS